MNSSKEHNNWLAVGEIIRSVKTTVEIYTDHIVKRWHQQLVSTYGSCTTAEQCRLKKGVKDLCACCKGWRKQVEFSHLNSHKSQIRGRKNCDATRWSLDPWEFFQVFHVPTGR